MLPNDSTAAQGTIDNHLNAFFQKNIDGVVADYAPDAVLFVRDGQLHGVSAIRGFFANFMATLPAGFLEAFKLHRKDVVGDVGYIVWEAAPWVQLGTDTFVVRDRKIVMQTFASHPASW